MMFDRTKTLTIFGRNPVLEALQDNSLQVTTLHLAESNKPGKDIRQLVQLAEARQLDIRYHSKLELSRISRNGKQDQGVAADIYCPNFKEASEISSGTFLCVDGIGNPQNLGMLARSVAALGLTGLIVSEEAGNTKISPLAIKASAGALFRCPIFKTRNLAATCTDLKTKDFQIVSLQANAELALQDLPSSNKQLFVLGNETEGLSQTVADQCTAHCHIKMHNGVESLNVAVTGALVAFHAMSQC